MFLLIIYYVAFSTAKCDFTQAKTLTAFLRQFRAPQPMSIFYDTTKETKITMIKSMSDQGVALDSNEGLQLSKNFLLVISQDNGFLDKNEEINIDQQIYFLTPSLDLYEKYTINNQLIQQKLGRFVDGIYIPEESIEQNFLKRRQNFKLLA